MMTPSLPIYTVNSTNLRAWVSDDSLSRGAVEAAAH